MLDLEDEVLDDALGLSCQCGQGAMTDDVDAAVGEQAERDEVRVPGSRQDWFSERSDAPVVQLVEARTGLGRSAMRKEAQRDERR